MGVYSNKNNSSVLTEADLNLDNVQESNAFGIEAAYTIVAENEMNYNRIMQAVGIDELAFAESTGTELIVYAESGEGFLSKVKEFIDKVIEKIKSIFKKFFGVIDSWVKSDKDFVAKYKKDLTTADTKDFEFQGYEFENLTLDIEAAGSAVLKKGESEFSIPANNDNASALSSAAENVFKANESKEDKLELMRGTAIGKGALTSSEFHKELFDHFRKGGSKEDIGSIVKPMTLMSELENSAAVKKQATTDYNKTIKFLNDAKKDIDNLEKALLKDATSKDETDKEGKGNAVRVAAINSDIIKESISIITIVNGAKMTALKDSSRQAKAICVKLLTYKPKHEAVTLHTEGSILAGIKLK